MYVDEYWRQFSQAHFNWYHAFTVMYVFIFALGVAANLMVLQYILTKKSKRPGLYFLMNLAVSDLLKIAINIPMNVVSNFYGEWVFGQIGCDIYVICGGVFGFVNISTLVFMSIERFLMIKNPLLALKLSKTTVFACIAISWIYSLACILPQQFLEHGFVLEGLLTSCTFNYLDRSLISRLNIMIMFIAGFFIPMTIILIVYALMWYNLRNNTAYSAINVRLALRQEQEAELLSMTSSQLAMAKFQRNSTTPTSEDYLKREVRVARTIILINLAFIVAWMPYALVALFAQYAPVASVPLFVTPFSTSLPSLLAKFSSIYNPILYTLTNDGCRAHFKYIFFKRLFRGKQTDF